MIIIIILKHINITKIRLMYDNTYKYQSNMCIVLVKYNNKIV